MAATGHQDEEFAQLLQKSLKLEEKDIKDVNEDEKIEEAIQNQLSHVIDKIETNEENFTQHLQKLREVEGKELEDIEKVDQLENPEGFVDQLEEVMDEAGNLEDELKRVDKALDALFNVFPGIGNGKDYHEQIKNTLEDLEMTKKVLYELDDRVRNHMY